MSFKHFLPQLSVLVKRSALTNKCVLQCTTARMSSSGPELHEMMKPLSWILGKWKSLNGEGHFPTIKDFAYIEEVEFFHVGQPNIQCCFYSSHPESKKPMHREVGFLRLKPNSDQVAIILSHNNGVCELEEGHMVGQEIKMESHTLGRLTFGKEPKTKKIARVFRRDGDILEQVVSMETSNTPMTEHLRIKYKKVE
ncbi:hypothetical protein ScPMuIL_017778 [Solemya velum]